MTTKKPASDESDSAPAEPTLPDVALIHGVTPDGEGLQIVRARENRLELGAVRPLREGAPLTGEVVSLRPRPNFPALCDVETHFKPPAAKASDVSVKSLAPRSGPAQVATEAYRRNWDAIWSERRDKSKLAN